MDRCHVMKMPTRSTLLLIVFTDRTGYIKYHIAQMDFITSLLLQGTGSFPIRHDLIACENLRYRCCQNFYCRFHNDIVYGCLQLLPLMKGDWSLFAIMLSCLNYFLYSLFVCSCSYHYIVDN